MAVSAALITVALAAAPDTGHATTPAQPPRIQERFAIKKRSPYAHASVGGHLRNDYYTTSALGVDVGFYTHEWLGLELRFVGLRSRLSRAARRVKRRAGLVPDTQPQRLALLAGARVSMGYGKVLLLDRYVVHFDPQVVGQAGIAAAQTRRLVTGVLGVGLLTHYQGGLQAKLDLLCTLQTERRRRGIVSSFGFLPMFSVGWSPGPLSAGEGSP